MAKPNPQYPRGNDVRDKRDRSEFEEAKEKLENEDRGRPGHKKPED